MTCTIRHPKARAASMNSSRAPARPAGMPTSESRRPPPSREEPTTRDLRGFKTPPPSPGPHHHETGELNLNHVIGAGRSIPLPVLREYHIKVRSRLLGRAYFPSATLADFSRARDSQITFSVTHGWSAFWRGRPWFAERRKGMVFDTNACTWRSIARSMACSFRLR